MSVIYRNGEEKFVGCTIGETSRYWSDGMISEYALVWNMDEHKTEKVETAYLDINGDGTYATSNIDINEEVYLDILRTYLPMAEKAWEEDFNSPRKGDTVKVVKGRKIPKGTELSVFWKGDKPTYQSRQCSWIHETETICGCKDSDGNTLWVKAEYLQRVNAVEDEEEKKDFIHKYFENNLPGLLPQLFSDGFCTKLNAMVIA